MTSLLYVVLLVSLVKFGAVSCADDENVESPCPSKFRYSFRSPPIGLLSFTLNEVLDEVDVKVMFSIPGSGEKIGRLQFLGDSDVRLKNGDIKRKLKYKIRFPDVPFLPKLTLLSVNGEVRCRGPPYKEPEYSGIQSITREDTYIHADEDDVEDVAPVRRPSRRGEKKKTKKKKDSEEEVEEEVAEDQDDEEEEEEK